MDADLIVVGSGAAGLTAATVAAAEGLRVVLLEASAWIGGTTAISGGMVWVPANALMQRAGLPDTLEAARTYLDHAAPPIPGQGAGVLEAFLQHGPEAIDYLMQRTAVQLQPVRTYPDYYPDLPGATAGGRVLEPVPFDGRELGAAFSQLRPPLPEFTILGGMMVHRSDIPHFRRMRHSLASAWHVARLVARHAWQRLSASRGTTLHLGNALAGRLLKSAMDLGVRLHLSTPVASLIVEQGQVVGVQTGSSPAPREWRARCGVVLACGGISHDAARRPSHVPALAGTLSATVSSGSREAASGAGLAAAVGARMSADERRQAFWVPASTFRRADGSQGVFPHTVTDRGKPGVIAVDAHGQRFVNEALSYHEFVKGQLRQGASAVPTHLICDRHFLWRYGLGKVKPFTRSLAADLASGYLKTGASLGELARSIGVPPDALRSTVEAFNADARRGVDQAFGRGGDIYQRHLGDGDQRPNPCVAPIEAPPFFAVRVEPADLGMAAGLITDASARVLDPQGNPIPGLYACGNDMQSVMNGAYPGPGITLGPALVFGYLAARHAAAQLMR